MECHLYFKKKEILSLATWTNVEDVMLSEIRKIQKNKYYVEMNTQ